MQATAVPDAPTAGPAPGTGSQADFARAQGWEKSYVTKLKKEGRLVFTADGLVDFAASLQAIKRSSGAPERAAEQVKGRTYSQAQDRERHYSAELRRLEYEREIRKLREASEVADVVADAGAIFRAGFEAWRDRLPPQIAALGGDESRIRSFLAAECEQLLKRMAERFRGLAAKGEATR